MGCIFPVVYYFVSRNPIPMGKFPGVKFIPIGIIIFFLILIIILEVERHKHPGLWPYITSRWYGKIFKKQPGKILGESCFLIGSLIPIVFFSSGIAIAALLFNAFGDAASGIVGVKYGRTKFFGGKKSVEGSLAFFIACLIIGLILLNSPRVSLNLTIIFIGAVVATLVELISIKIDDNLSVPIISGIWMQLFHL
ncbi:MAG: SEC59/DGK1/VTE5 family protein [bacterium]|nr:SEC59/DGK1/VTE5 family protein [bacterium]